jgi:hypothetical protein
MREEMQGRDHEQLKLLHQRYLEEARKFTEALQVNASSKELLIIRKNVRMLLQEIRSFIRSAGTSGQL